MWKSILQVRSISHTSGLLQTVVNGANINNNVDNVSNKVATENGTERIKPAGWDEAKPYEAIPGPMPVPIIGNFWRFYRADIKDVLKMHTLLNADFGDIAKFHNAGSMPEMLFLYNVNDIEKMYWYGDGQGGWPIREGFNSLNNYRTKIRKELYGDVGSLLTRQQQEWHDFRTLVAPIVLKPQGADLYISSIDNVASDFLNRIRDLVKSNPNGEMPHNFLNILNTWAFESIGVITLDKRLGCLDENPNEEALTSAKYMVEIFKSYYNIDIEPLGKYHILFNTKLWQKYVRYQDYFTNMVMGDIDEALTKLSQQQQEKPVEEQSAFEQVLKKDKKVAISLTMDMMSAGIDTTGKFAAATLYFLARYPNIQATLREEIMRILPTKNTPLDKEKLKGATYLRAVLRETLRIAPVTAGNLRKTQQDLVLSGYQVPSGTTLVVPNLYLSHLDKHFPRAKEFIPERWLRTTKCKLSHKNTNGFVTLPFGHGSRTCLGKRLANLETEILTAKIIRNFELSWPHPDMTFAQEFLYGVMDPLKIHFKEINE